LIKPPASPTTTRNSLYAYIPDISFVKSYTKGLSTKNISSMLRGMGYGSSYDKLSL
jgi:hypothetical protein